MARLPFVSAAEIPDGEPNIVARIEAERGEVPNIYRVLANHPRLADAFRTLALAVRTESGLDPRLRELAILAVMSAAPAPYELAHHRVMAAGAGVSEAQLEALEDFETAPVFDEVERAVMRYAREATVSLSVADATWEALTANLPRQEALGVVLQVALYNASARISVPLQIELEPEFAG